MKNQPTALEILGTARCGHCGGKVEPRLNVVMLNHRAAWKYPSAGNVITGEFGRAVGVCCDACIEARTPPREAVEFRDGQVFYHPIESLEAMPPEQS